MTTPAVHTAFFYGTLMAPEVLHRVCHGSRSPSNPIYATHNLKIRPAILSGHRRHRVKNADYPAILPHPGSSNNTNEVRGTCVTGLTDADIWRLDIFEGDEYERVKVQCRLLVPDDDGEEREACELTEAETYVWVAGEQRLEVEEWDFDEFRKEKMRFWVGKEGEGEFAEVDDAVAEARTGGRGVNGNGSISSILAQEHKKDGTP